MASIAYLDLVIGDAGDDDRGDRGAADADRAGGWSGGASACCRRVTSRCWATSGCQKALGYLIPTMLLLVGNQGMYQKFFSARSEKDAKLRGVRMDRRDAAAGNAADHAGGDRKRAISQRISRAKLFALAARRGLPTLVGAILLGGIFAKVISTANNYLFSPATNLIHDVYSSDSSIRKLRRSRVLIMSRLLVVGAGGIRVVAGDAVRIDFERVAVRVYRLRRGGDAGGAGRIFLEANHYRGRGHVDRAGHGGHGGVERRAGAWDGKTMSTRCIRRWRRRWRA